MPASLGRSQIYILERVMYADVALHPIPYGYLNYTLVDVHADEDLVAWFVTALSAHIHLQGLNLMLPFPIPCCH